MELSKILHGQNPTENNTVPNGTCITTSEGGSILKNTQQSSKNSKRANVKQLTDEEFPKILDNISKQHGPNIVITKDVNWKVNHMLDNLGKKQMLNKLLQGPMKRTWQKALFNKLGRLAQGIDTVQGKHVVNFISYKDVTKNKTVTFANMVCDIRPLKSEKYRVRLTVGKDRL